MDGDAVDRTLCDLVKSKLSPSIRAPLLRAHFDFAAWVSIIPNMESAVRDQDRTLRTATAFAGHAEDWERYVASPLGRLRQDLVTTHLLHHLRLLPTSVTVLDAGAGTGGYAIALAKQGHHVCLLDFAVGMLKIAQRSVAGADPSLLQRVDFCCFPVEQVSEYFPSKHFQAVLVHTLLEYLDEPWAVLRSLIDVLAPGGLLSLLVVNPRAEPFRLAWTKRDLARAREALTVSVSEADLFGLPRRILPPHEIRRALLEAHIDIVAEYGIRIFADHFTTDELADTGFYLTLKELEVAASRLEPYKRVARYLHIVGIRQTKASLQKG